MRSSQSDPLISIDGLTHIYGGLTDARPVEALSDVDLTIATGEYVALIGANGSGKTTLARHLNALLLPTSGQVRVAGHDTRDPTHLREIRSTVGMVLQSPEDQLVGTIVEEDVAFGPENLGIAEDELAGRVRHALEMVGLWEQHERPPHMLSAGQQQRLAIAGALALQPRCLVLDEATAMLDPEGRRELLSLLHELHHQGLTIISITHHMDEAARAERVIALQRGRIALDSSPAEVFSDQAGLENMDLGLPPVAELSARLRAQVPALPRGLLTASELATALSRVLSPSDTTLSAGHGNELPLTDTPARQRPDATHGRSPAARSGAPLIAIRDLHHTYMAGTPLQQPALAGVDFDLWPGEVVGLIGSTGSGKSTLLQHLNGLLRPQRGTVHVDGHDLGDPETDLRAIRRMVGLVFQRPEHQLFERYVGDDIAYGPRMMGLAGVDLRQRVEWAMENVGLDFHAYKDRLTFTLSGGEQRRAALAGVLALRPRILALDEPTSGLDPAARDELLRWLLELRNGGHTLVVATHNMDDIAVLADRVVVLDDGQVVLQGPTRQVFAQSERLRALGLGVPTAVEISIALHEAGVIVPQNLLTLEEVESALMPLLTEGFTTLHARDDAP